MQIKRFEAKDMTTALRMVKEELGADAVILSARSKRKGKGFFGSLKYAGVEVSAAIDGQLPAARHRRTSYGRDSYRGIAARRTEKSKSAGYAAHQPHDTATAGARTHKASRNGAGNASASREHVKAMSSLYQQILLQEVDRSIASELIEEIKRIPASEEILACGNIKPHIGSLLEEMGVSVQSENVPGDRQKVVVVVGSTGVGKTTTIAKLAAREVNQNRKNVGLVTTDNYSIAALYQLETYARIIDIPLKKATGAGELQKAVKQFSDKEIIFIDTPGLNPRDRDQIQELTRCLAGLTKPQIHLVMSATTKEKDCISMAAAFKGLGPHHLLFTRLDESSSYGNIVNLLIQTRLPLSFLCSGRRVPNDIEAGSVQRLVDLLFENEGRLSGQMTVADMPEAGAGTTEIKADRLPRFVANKNSDVYHVTDCKWAKKIKPANTLKFDGALEAEAQNYLPCRSCRPERERQTGHLEINRGMVKSYGHL